MEVAYWDRENALCLARGVNSVISRQSNWLFFLAELISGRAKFAGKDQSATGTAPLVAVTGQGTSAPRSAVLTYEKMQGSVIIHSVSLASTRTIDLRTFVDETTPLLSLIHI